MGDIVAVIKDQFLAAAREALPEFATEEIALRMERLAGHLSEVGSHMNLTAITEPTAVVWLHLIDSLYAARVISEMSGSIPSLSIADVGSGGGFPALPIAAALPRVKVTAIDSTEKKCSYIEDCARVMGLENIGTAAVRAEELSHTDARETFGAVTARAVARLNVLMELCLPLVGIGGLFISMKGATAEEEEREAAAAAKELGAVLFDKISYTLSGYADERTILVYRKIMNTPEKYPRKYSKISKSPL